MGHEQCGLMARLWRSCGSARKTSRIAGSCRVCRRCNISRYRRTVCTAARSGVCDRRERSLRHLTAVRRATPKRKERSCASRPRCERGALPRRRRARRGRSTSMAGPPWSPAVRALVASTRLRLSTTQRRPNWSARSRRKGCTRPSRSIAAASVRSAADAGRRAVRDRDRRAKASPVDEPKETLGNAIKLPPWCESRRAEIVAALAPLRRSPARQRVAGRWSRKILICAPGARFIPSLRPWSRSNYVCARGRGGHEAFIASDYRRWR
jgi:hypothetical protein